MKHIAVVNGAHCCYVTDNGIRKHFLGCAHETPRAAIRHTVTDDYVSPLRSSGSEPPPSRGSSPRLPPAVGSLPEPRQRRSDADGGG